MEITEDFFNNVLKMFKHFRTNIYHFVNMPVERETYTWNLISYPFTVNAFHLQQLNSIGNISKYWPGALDLGGHLPTQLSDKIGILYWGILPTQLLGNGSEVSNKQGFYKKGARRTCAPILEFSESK